MDNSVFFEVAAAEGEGTLVHHGVYRDDVYSNGRLFNVAPETTQVLVEQIDEARFSEFHEIHGGDRAV